MKIRSGFVSNSSSSSFIVVIDEEPKTVEELEEMMYGVSRKINFDGLGEFETKEIAKRVFNDMKNQNKEDFDIFGLFYDEPITNIISWLVDFGYINEYDLDEIFEKYTNKDIKNKFKQLIKDEKDVYCFEYSDNDGHFDTFLEHGDIFHWFKHFRISNH